MAWKNSPLVRFRENHREKREEARIKRERERRRALLVCGGLLVLLVPVFIVGIVSERRDAAEAAAASSALPPAPTPAAPATSQPPPAPEPSATEEDADDEPVEYDEDHLRFGQTAHFQSRVGDNDIPLEFTVSAPKPFKFSKDAQLIDAKDYGPVTEGPRMKTNVYFTLTIRNFSNTQAFDTGFVFSSVDQTGDDDRVSQVYDKDIVGDIGLPKSIKPGKSVTIKVGFSVKSADNIQYELDVDGLAGQSFYFTK